MTFTFPTGQNIIFVCIFLVMVPWSRVPWPIGEGCHCS